MIELFPNTYNQFTCPSCNATPVNLIKLIYQGIHLVADLECPACNLKFYHDLPSGHSILYPVIIDKKLNNLIAPKDIDWYARPLLQSLITPSQEQIQIEKRNSAPITANDSVILLNCIDTWYGHVLLKLLNIQFYHQKHPDLKKILLIPRGFEWMVPPYADEVWIVNLGLGKLNHYYTLLDQFIQNELSKYARACYSSGYSHPRLQDISAQDFFKTKAFVKEQFDSKPRKITIIYREDRLWLNPAFNKVFNYLNFRKIKTFNPVFLAMQVRKINLLAAAIKKTMPDVEIVVCGLGQYGKFSNYISDMRNVSLSESQELQWCRIYSESHIVMGIHGSNMLIPSCLAAGWIEILPDERIGNITQDLFCKYEGPEMSYYGRFASEYDPISRIALLAEKMLKDHHSFSMHQIQSFD
ncbi:MAG: hypothetical protein ACO1NW_04930 [Chitinophagaceae bacterium]